MDIAVVGAGVFGSWTAWHLAGRGHSVTLVDAYGPANGRASSADHSRVIRAGYGADAIYSRWASESLDDWRWLASASGQTLLTTTGALFLGEAGNSYVRATYDTLSALRLPAEWIEPAALALRHPQIQTGDLGPAVLERDAGVLRARSAVQAITRLAVEQRSVRYLAARVMPLDESRAAARVAVAAGGEVAGDAYVLACGPWLPHLLPQAIGDRIRPTRQEVLYFGVPAGDTRFSVPHLPVWIDFAAGVYGIPDIASHGFKVGIDRHGAPIDPDSEERVVDRPLVETTRRWLSHRFPALAAAPLTDARVCQYENTSSGDFILDRHPAWPNVWIAGGGSGHGFKHGPAVGRYVAGLVQGDTPAQPRFALAGKTARAARAVF